MFMKFQEIIPANDRLSCELSEVKGGIASTGVVCDTGAVCETGKTEPEPIIIIIEEPGGPGPFYPALG
ncbi:hypothetical protein CLI72_05160 [Porphyromonas gingivalis]|nr:hypothetical protein CLI72_05160 [Porphyromonas gingivalis]